MPYVKITNFATKDSLSSGDPLKIVRGEEIDDEFNAIATATDLFLAKDGSVLPTQNIPMNAKKLTGLAAGTARTDAASLANIQDKTGVYVATVGGTADVITLTPSPAITAYVAGQEFSFIATGTNTTNVTVAVSGLAAKAVTKNGATALASGDIPSGALVTIKYDGTQYQLTVTALADGAVSTAKLAAGVINGLTTVTALSSDYVSIADASDSGNAKKALISDIISLSGVSIVGVSKNLIITNNSGTPNSQLDIDADEIILKDSNGNAYLASAVNLTINIAASGANGLDAGSEANSTWYYAYVIYNPTTATVAGILSVSATAPTLPSGYTYSSGQIGAIYNTSGGNFIKILQRDKKVVVEEIRVIIDGAITPLAWTGVSVTAFFPPTAKTVVIAGAEQASISYRSDGVGGNYSFTGQAGTPRALAIFPTARSYWSTLTCFYAATLYYYIPASPGSLIPTGWEY